VLDNVFVQSQCICPECWEHRKVDEKRTKECMFSKMFSEIDKLAGPKFA